MYSINNLNIAGHVRVHRRSDLHRQLRQPRRPTCAPLAAHKKPGLTDRNPAWQRMPRHHPPSNALQERNDARSDTKTW